VLQNLQSLRSSPGVAAPRQLPDLFRVGEGQLSRERRFQIALTELDLPTLTKKEGQVDAMARKVVAGQTRELESINS
jgi:hypothetical protein